MNATAPSRLVRRLAAMNAGELAWRLRTAARTAAQNALCSMRAPRWRRADLPARLLRSETPGDVHSALGTGRWNEAHNALQRHFARRVPCFVLSPSDRPARAVDLRHHYPSASLDAARRADRMLEGKLDLLGYRGLRFEGDWHRDPVSNRTAPRVFFARVPYLDPRYGDHKVVWELNRHQHWLSLGRAFWLTGDERYRAAFVDELESWLDANPPLVGINWASMLELALRSISWLWALQFFARDEGPADSTPWTVDLLLGLDRQLTHVEHNLSHYFSPNTHLLGEALALYVAGRALPELAASRRRARVGRRLLVAEATRQIADDGFHCERSTHYHRYTLDFYSLALAVARLTRDPIAAVFERTVVRLASAARAIAGDDGRVPHLGDDDGGMLLPIAGREPDDWRDSLATAATLTGRRDLCIGDTPEETVWMTGRPGLPLAGSVGAAGTPVPAEAAGGRSTALDRTGYYVSRSAGHHLVFDGGAHGYLNAGHAHADALSMTLSLSGRPLLIDAGTACYTTDPALRDRFRGTAAHNTLVLDDRPQSLPAGPFHWSRVADAVTHRWRPAGGFDYVDASHAGYAPAIHRRRVLVLHGDLVIVVDSVDGTGRHKAAVHWHIDPRWTAAPRARSVAFASGDARAGLVVPQGQVDLFTGDAEAGLGWHSPAYGRVEPATTVRIAHEGQAPFAIVTVFDLAPLDPIETVDWLPVWAEAGAVKQSSAIRIARGGSTDYAAFVDAPSASRAVWRVAEFATDAHMLCWRVARTGEVTRLAMVDGSFVRGAGRRALSVALGRVLPSVLIDESTIRNFTPCAASPVS